MSLIFTVLAFVAGNASGATVLYAFVRKQLASVVADAPAVAATVVAAVEKKV
jgi:hypothetical protein